MVTGVVAAALYHFPRRRKPDCRGRRDLGGHFVSGRSFKWSSANQGFWQPHTPNRAPNIHELSCEFGQPSILMKTKKLALERAHTKPMLLITRSRARDSAHRVRVSSWGKISCSLYALVFLSCPTYRSPVKLHIKSFTLIAILN